MELLTAKHLTFTYPDCKQPALQDVSFVIEAGSFTVVCGATGSGKSTLLRLLKPELAPLGELHGEISYGKQPCQIGFVMQKPEQQIVTDKVWHELAFGLENMGLPQQVIAARVAEMASYFGIESWYERRVCDLSGGQKQLLNLAAVMAMHPDILILDEPTAQLDPIAATDFIGTLQKLNQDFSLTILIVEHRLEELIPICDKMLVLEQGSVLTYDAPRTVVGQLQQHQELFCAMPTASRVFHGLSGKGVCPLTVREGRNFLEENFGNAVPCLEAQPYEHSAKPALDFSQVYFRYEKKGVDVLRELSFRVYENEIYCMLGGNGSGKTTSLNVAAGFLRPYSGRVKTYNNLVAVLPQDVQTLFLKNTVAEELSDSGVDVADLPFDLSPFLEKHPYDLSGGEQQLVALAKVLAVKPKLLLLDEPTKGLDAYKKQQLAGILRRLKASGVTVVVVTHDVEFAASCGDRCGLLFRGAMVAEGVPTEFFGENHFYTTAASRMTKGYCKNAVTVEQVVASCK